MIMNKHTKADTTKSETFQVTTVHCVAGRDAEVSVVSLPDGWYGEVDMSVTATWTAAKERMYLRNTAKALRDAGLLFKGQTVRGTRAEKDGTFVVFPGKVPGLSSSITHSITLHPSLGMYPQAAK
jgi:hypothetical protein